VKAIRRVLLTAGIAGSLIVLPVAALLGTSNENDGFKLFLGKNQDELVRQGRLEYPDEDHAHNHPCHRLAARLTTDKYGPLVALAGGAWNEVVEAVTLLAFGRNPLSQEHVSETLGDLSVNWRGMRDSLGDTLHLGARKSAAASGADPGASRPQGRARSQRALDGAGRGGGD